MFNFVHTYFKLLIMQITTRTDRRTIYFVILYIRIIIIKYSLKIIAGLGYHKFLFVHCDVYLVYFVMLIAAVGCITPG